MTEDKCQARIERILEQITEDVIEPIINFYVPKERDKENSFWMWRIAKKYAMENYEKEEVSP